MHRGLEEHFSELHHLEEADAHDGRFGVVAPAQAGDEAGGEGDDVFEGAAEGDAGDVGDEAHVEVGAVEEGLEEGVVDGRELGGHGAEFFLVARFVRLAGVGDLGEVEFGVAGGGAFGGGVLRVEVRGVVGDGRFGEFFLRYFVGDVGAGEGTAVDAEFGADGFGEETYAGGGDVDAFDAGDAAGVGQDVAFHLVAEAADELVREVEDEDGGVFDGILEGRVGDKVMREGNVRQVFDVLMEVVDEFRELLRLRRQLGGGVVIFRTLRHGCLFFKHPHLHFGLEEVRVGCGVFGDDLGYGRPPPRYC